MRFRNTLLLAAIVLALGGYLYFVEGPSHERSEAEKKLLTFKPEDVTEVTLTYPDKQIVIAKVGDGWHLDKPISVRADQSAVDNLIRAAGDAEVKRTIEKPQGLETYGLDKPETLVAIKLLSGKSLPAIRLGKAAPVGFSAYAQLEGSPDVKLVPSIFQSGMKREVKDLRDKQVIDFKEDEVRSVEIAGGDATIELERDGTNWKIAQPKQLAADPNEVRSLLSSIKGVRAEDFVDEPAALEEYGLDKPRRKITVDLGKDTHRELWVGAEKAKDSKNVLYVKKPDDKTVYAVGSWSWKGLDKDVGTLRDKTVIAFDPLNLGAIEITRREGDSYRLVKEAAPAASPTPAAGGEAAEPAWKVEGAKRSKSVAIAGLAGDLHGLKGYEVAAEKPADLSKFGLAAPDVTLSLIDTSGKPIGRVLASQTGGGEGGEGQAYAMADGGDIVYRVRGYLYAHLDKKKEDFIEPEPAPAATPAANKK